MDRIYLLLPLLTSFWTTGYCRSPGDGIQCIDAAAKCRGNRECQMALRSLDEKCKVLFGRCGAKMVDLPRCGEIMDQIFSLGFPEEPCTCTRNSRKCSSLYHKIYSHPCFASIRHLRKHNLFPAKILSQGTNGFPTAVPQSSKAAHVSKEYDSDVKSPVVSIGITTTVSTPLVKAKGNAGGKFTVAVPKDDTKTDKVTVTKHPRKTNSASGSQKRGSSFEDIRKPEGIQQLEDKTDYKLITIILGTILGLFILTAVVFFAWMRVRKTIFYTNGKVQVSNRGKGDGAVSSRSESGMPPRSKA